jgi:ribulose 1,5-bisphosphate synthetase/thiazole synthase
MSETCDLDVIVVGCGGAGLSASDYRNEGRRRIP